MTVSRESAAAAPAQATSSRPSAAVAVDIRAIDDGGLEAANAVIAAAIETWDIAPRVRRLLMPSFRYVRDDLAHLAIFGAWWGDDLVGVAAMERTDPVDSPTGHAAMLVHGLYVHPAVHGRGIGGRLLAAARHYSRKHGATGLLVRAERHATGFFERQGFQRLPVTDPRRDYPYRLWSPLGLRHGDIEPTAAQQGPRPQHGRAAPRARGGPVRRR